MTDWAANGPGNTPTTRGTYFGNSRAESVCLDTPWDGIAKRLDKWNKKSTWLTSFDDDSKFHGRVLPEKTNDQEYLRKFRAAYVAAGLKFIKNYIKELKDDGLLQEKR